METTKIFENLLQLIKMSNLNFRLEQSPFSATIYLKKSFIKDKYGISMIPPQTLDLQAQRENQAVDQKVIYLENLIQSLKYDYATVVMDSEETHRVKTDLETEVKTLRTRLEDTKKVDLENNDAKTKYTSGMAEKAALNYKLDKNKGLLEEIATQNKKLKNEVKTLNLKHEKVIDELKCTKNEKEDLQKENNSLNVALQSSKKDLKEMVKKNEIERKSLENKIRVLTEYRIKHEEESRELKRKQKKLLKKG